jgi:hypothetical protein
VGGTRVNGIVITPICEVEKANDGEGPEAAGNRGLESFRVACSSRVRRPRTGRGQLETVAGKHDGGPDEAGPGKSRQECRVVDSGTTRDTSESREGSVARRNAPEKSP